MILRESLVSARAYHRAVTGSTKGAVEEAGAAAQALDRLAPGSVEAADANLSLAQLEVSAGQVDTALRRFDATMVDYERLSAGRPYRLAAARQTFALSLFNARAPALAEQTMRQAYEGFVQWAGRGHPSTAVSAMWLGRMLVIRGELTKGRALLQEAKQIIDARAGDMTPDELLLLHTSLGEALLDEGRLRDAGPVFEQARPLQARATPSWLALHELVHARYLLDTGAFNEATEILERARQSRLAMFGERSVPVGSVENRLGLVALARGDRALARVHFERALQTQERAEGTFGSIRHQATSNLAALALDEGSAADALPTYEAQIAQVMTLPPAQRGRLLELSVRVRHGSALLSLGRVEEARTTASRAIELSQALYENSPPRFNTWLLQARLAVADGKLDQAWLAVDRAEAILRAAPLGPHFSRSLAKVRAEVETAQARSGLAHRGS